MESLVLALNTSLDAQTTPHVARRAIMSGGGRVSTRATHRSRRCEWRSHQTERGDVRPHFLSQSRLDCCCAAHGTRQKHEMRTLQVLALDQLSELRCLYICREFDPNFKAVAKAWQSVPKAERNKHFFASLDFADGPNVFRRVGSRL